MVLGVALSLVLPDLTTKKAGWPVKSEFPINNEYFFNISMFHVILGHIHTLKNFYCLSEMIWALCILSGNSDGSFCPVLTNLCPRKGVQSWVMRLSPAEAILRWADSWGLPASSPLNSWENKSFRLKREFGELFNSVCCRSRLNNLLIGMYWWDIVFTESTGGLGTQTQKIAMRVEQQEKHAKVTPQEQSELLLQKPQPTSPSNGHSALLQPCWILPLHYCVSLWDAKSWSEHLIGWFGSHVHPPVSVMAWGVLLPIYSFTNGDSLQK